MAISPWCLLCISRTTLRIATGPRYVRLELTLFFRDDRLEDDVRGELLTSWKVRKITAQSQNILGKWAGHAVRQFGHKASSLASRTYDMYIHTIPRTY